MYRCDEKIVFTMLKELKLRPLRREALYFDMAKKIALPRSVFDRHLKFLLEKKRIGKGPQKNDPYSITELEVKFLEALSSN